MKKMYQVVLKNNKNGAKLFNSPIEAFKYIITFIFNIIP